MKVVLLFGIYLFGNMMEVESITCYRCTAGIFQGATETNVQDDCYDNLSGSSVTETTDVTGSGVYCFTTLTLNDGVVTAIARGQTTGASDADQTSMGVPVANPMCITAYVNGGEVTTCTHTCTTSKCNTLKIDNYKICPTSCSEKEHRGYCDYFAGSCVCQATYTGPNCNSTAAKTYRSCVQCNSETNSNCETLTTATQCPINADASLVYCTSSMTTLFSSSIVKHTGVTKGCVLKSSVRHEQCAYSTTADQQFSAYREYTCTATCDTDGCNSIVPAGNSALMCVQCTGTADSAGCATQTKRSSCPTGSNQCYSKAVYYITNKTNHLQSEDPDYTFSSIERGCRTSNSPVKKCITAAVASSQVQMVTCEQSCTTAGCNIGWPHRPTCWKCDSTTQEYDSCTFNPTTADLGACPKPYQSYCVFRESAKSGTSGKGPQYDGYPRSMRRGCSYHHLGNKCADIKIDGVTFKQCNKTCTTDGCNQGHHSGAAKQVQSFVMLFIAPFLSYSMQRFVA